MTHSGRTALILCLIALVPVLLIPAFLMGLWVGVLVCLVPLTLAVFLALRPRK